jgi:hypothetical protein
MWVGAALAAAGAVIAVLAGAGARRAARTYDPVAADPRTWRRTSAEPAAAGRR